MFSWTGRYAVWRPSQVSLHKTVVRKLSYFVVLFCGLELVSCELFSTSSCNTHAFLNTFSK